MLSHDGLQGRCMVARAMLGDLICAYSFNMYILNRFLLGWPDRHRFSRYARLLIGEPSFKDFMIWRETLMIDLK